MTYEDLMKSVAGVKIDLEYEPITTCPPDPVKCEGTKRTFLGEEKENPSNVIGREDYRGLRALCFNAPREEWER